MDVLQMRFAVVSDDALAFPSGNVAPSSKPMIVYCRVPHTMAEGDWEPFNESRWPADKALTASAQELLFAALYGHNWRLGNEDGSRYVLQGVEMRAHRPDVAWEPPANAGSGATFSRHYFCVDSQGEFQRCQPEAVVAALW